MQKPLPEAFHGTFIQLLSKHQSWEARDWERLFSYLKQLHISQLIVQWTTLDGIEFFNEGTNRKEEKAPLNFILQKADAAGIKVFVGLAHHPEYWSETQKDTASVRNYLSVLGGNAKALADRLAPVLRNHPSFQGWYITEEIDDTNWQEPDRREPLFTYLSELTGHLHELTPDKPVAVSGFSNAAMDPPSFRAFWDNCLKAVPVDIVLFQDGIGAGKLTFQNLPSYLDAVHEATQSNGRDLQIIVEIFESTAGSHNPASFTARPAGLGRIEKQMRLERPYASLLIAFSIPEYMTPLAGPEAEKLFKEYLAIQAKSLPPPFQRPLTP